VSKLQPASRTADKRYFGVAEGIVTSVEDPEHEGRVRLRLPWFDADDITDWCRSANLFAGNGYGSTWTPEVGDEVLVGFIHGDLRFPVVLGGLYNGQDKPPAYRQGDRNEKVLRSRAGHEIVVDDTPSRLGVRVTSSGGHRLVLDDSAGRVELTTKSGHGLTIDDRTGQLLLTAKSIEVKAAGPVTVTGTPIKLN
jgi:phage baseplate assembly protein V